MTPLGEKSVVEEGQSVRMLTERSMFPGLIAQHNAFQGRASISHHRRSPVESSSIEADQKYYMYLILSGDYDCRSSGLESTVGYCVRMEC